MLTFGPAHRTTGCNSDRYGRLAEQHHPDRIKEEPPLESAVTGGTPSAPALQSSVNLVKAQHGCKAVLEQRFVWLLL